MDLPSATRQVVYYAEIVTGVSLYNNSSDGLAIKIANQHNITYLSCSNKCELLAILRPGVIYEFVTCEIGQLKRWPTCYRLRPNISRTVTSRYKERYSFAVRGPFQREITTRQHKSLDRFTSFRWDQTNPRLILLTKIPVCDQLSVRREPRRN